MMKVNPHKGYGVRASLYETWVIRTTLEHVSKRWRKLARELGVELSDFMDGGPTAPYRVAGTQVTGKVPRKYTFLPEDVKGGFYDEVCRLKIAVGQVGSRADVDTNGTIEAVVRRYAQHWASSEMVQGKDVSTEAVAGYSEGLRYALREMTGYHDLHQ